MSDRARAGLAAVGLVLVGFALGVFADHLWLASRTPRTEAQLTHREAMVEMLHSLDLTDEQRAAIDAIIRRSEAKIEEQFAAVHPQLLATIDSARHEIEALLEPDQLRAFHEWIRAERQRLGPQRFPAIRH